MIDFDKHILNFTSVLQKHSVQLLLVGGAAVNFHGYQRHSADVDFWIDTSPDNMQRFVEALQDLSFEIDGLPDMVMRREQNMSLKFVPDFEIEVITRFDVGKTFAEAYKDASIKEVCGISYRVLSLKDLITSKVKAGRPKDLLDVMELKRINNLT